MQKCDSCGHINPTTFNSTCKGCGRIVCLVCLIAENYECSVCGGYYIEPAPFWEIISNQKNQYDKSATHGSLDAFTSS